MSSAAVRNRANRRFDWWYEIIIDWMMANPGATYVECAKFFRKSPTTISLIVNSDMFRLRLSQRRAALSSRVTDRVIALTTGVAEKALRIVDSKLDNEAQLSAASAMDIADRALARLGYNPPNTGASTHIEVHQDNRTLAVSSQVLSDARQKLRANEVQKIAANELPRTRVLELSVNEEKK